MTSLSPVPARQDASWIWHHPDTPAEVLAADLRRCRARARRRELEARAQDPELRRLLVLAVVLRLVQQVEQILERLAESRQQAEEYGR